MRPLLLVPLLAGCCECVLVGPPNDVVVPTAFQSGSVPTNVVGVLGMADGTSVEESVAAFVAEDGTAVLAVVTPVLTGIDHWFELWTPVEPLAPGTLYDMGPAVFTTAEGPDDAPPPEVPLFVGEHGQDRCGPWLQLAYDPNADGIEDVAFFETEVSEDEGFAEPLRYFGGHWGGCYSLDGYPWDPREDLWLRGRAVDLAGNTSAWSEPMLHEGRWWR
jgi:hypothetical protein